ncbi:AT-rich interactive domain-containing protein 3B-like protein, partial [Lates japonicus]
MHSSCRPLEMSSRCVTRLHTILARVPGGTGLSENGSASWADEADSSRGRGEASRDFAKLYELDSDPKRKEFLDDLFTFMQKR